jgi:ribosome-binding factor A
LRRAISQELTLKFAPELRFMIDETFYRMEETRRLLASENVVRDLDKE